MHSQRYSVTEYQGFEAKALRVYARGAFFIRRPGEKKETFEAEHVPG
jgi:hypothetical protein